MEELGKVKKESKVLREFMENSCREAIRTASDEMKQKQKVQSKEMERQDIINRHTVEFRIQALVQRPEEGLKQRYHSQGKYGGSASKSSLNAKKFSA
jgi:hypothetical protein